MTALAVRRTAPGLLAVVGDSGSGKATLCAGISRLLGPERVTDLWLDDYHRYDRAERQRLGITALHPDCNRLDVMREHLRRLRRGEPVRKPVYDHRTGAFAPEETLVPREFIVAHGLLALHDGEAARCYDLSVFLDPDPDLHAGWKLHRDIAVRGYTPEEVHRQLALRRADVERFVRPQRERADVVVCFRAGTRGATVVLSREPDAAIAAALPARRETAGVVIELPGTMPEHRARAAADAIARTCELRPALDVLGEYRDGATARRSMVLALLQLLIAALFLDACARRRRRDERPPAGAARPGHGEPDHAGTNWPVRLSS